MKPKYGFLFYKVLQKWRNKFIQAFLLIRKKDNEKRLGVSEIGTIDDFLGSLEVEIINMS